MDLFSVRLSVDYAGVGQGRSPYAAGAVDVSVIGDEDDVFAVGRPCRRDLVVKLRVVVARQRADIFFCQLADGPWLTAIHLHQKNVKVLGSRGRNIRDALSIRRPARLYIDRTVFR